MTEKYEKISTTEIAVRYILSAITAYNLISTILTPAPDYVSSPRAYQQLEERLQSSESKLKETLEIDSTQMDTFDTIMEALKKNR